MESKDRAHSLHSLIRLWGAPALLIILGSMGEYFAWWQSFISGILSVVGIFWIGCLCLKNAFHCGRVHCFLIGISYPILALYAFGIAINAISTPWSIFWNIFLVVTIISFVPEFFGKKYIKQAGNSTT